jgi:hypothetical protein
LLLKTARGKTNHFAWAYLTGNALEDVLRSR